MLLMNLHRIVIIVAITLILALFGCANKVELKESELPSSEIASTEIAAGTIEPITINETGIPYEILLHGGAPHSTSSILVGDVLGTAVLSFW